MRPEKLNVEYFPHWIGDGKKMFILENKYPEDGYRTWYKLLELLAKTDNHYLDLNDETELMFVASYCRCKEDILKSIISDIVKFKEFDPELWSIGVIWCQKFVDSISQAYAKRKNDVITKSEICKIFIDLKRLNPEKIEIEENPKPKKPEINVKKFDIRREMVELGFNAELIDDWLKVRKEKRGVNTATALKKFTAEVEKTNHDKNEILELCVYKSWISFSSSWNWKQTLIEFKNGNTENIKTGSRTTESERQDYE